MKNILLGACLLTSGILQAQDSLNNSTAVAPAVTFSGYLEAYYSYDFNKPPTNDKAGFLYSHNRHNEINLNLGFVKGSYSTERVRANLALAAGTYMNANYAAETGVLKNVFEANAGLKLSAKSNLWLDAGIFSSHIGFESAISKDCWTLSRSLIAENTPYYESGAKLTYISNNNKWLLSALVLNGWQRIRRVEGNTLMSYGTQVQYKPSAKATLNYSTFIGTDKPDSARRMRYYHNLYGVFTMGKLGITAGLDIGMEQKSKGSSEMNTLYAPVMILRYSANDKWAIAARGEYYDDEDGIIIATGTPEGFKTSGISLNVDYMPVPAAVIRIEGRILKSKDEIFTRNTESRDVNSFVTASIAVSF
ncbi:MAG: porin [Gemmatimonadaceae bacterium]|nr:porin [Chitinophagaceae bacterium]